MDWRLFGSTFLLIFVAELPDKTALANVIMASRGRPLAVFAGAALAFVIQSAVAVCFGRAFAFLPPAFVHFAAGALFLFFAFRMWRQKEESATDDVDIDIIRAGKQGSFWRSCASAFAVIFLAEWGDLTQLATATLVAKYQAPIVLFCAATLGLWAATAISVTIGHHARRFLHPERIQRLAALAFLAVGVWMIVSQFLSSERIP